MMSYPADELQAVLSEPGPFLPELALRDAAAWAETPVGRQMLEWGRTAGPEIPETTYTKYREFLRSGQRPPYEAPYFLKRTYLTQETCAAWLGQDDGRIDRINDLIWSICEETNWVLPAHEHQAHDGPYIDLFAAETAVDLAHVLMILGDRLPGEVQNRVRAEIQERILTPYLERGDTFWWDCGSNNWTGVCAGSVGQTFLLLEPDVARQAEALSRVLAQLGRFIDRAFTEDGACLEGIGYWNYGLIHFVSFAEMLRSRTNGRIDLLGLEKVRRIAHYPSMVALDRHVFASFADSHESSSIYPFLAARLAERTGEGMLLAQVGTPTGSRFTTALRNILWWDGSVPALPAAEDLVLPEAGLVRFVAEASGRRLALMAKGGHNAEPHNHNDVGSFILRIGGVTYLCDPGGGLYSKAYFGRDRYENVFANSYGHSVPRIGGRLQEAGAERRGVVEALPGKSARISFADAYPGPGLSALERTLRLEPDGTVSFVDEFRFEGDGLEVEEAFITWLDVAVDGGTARIASDEGVLELRIQDATWTAERLEEACKANAKRGVLTRISATYPPSTARRVECTMAFRPKD
ncbi:MAG: heparinase II/III family protein [Candidatus Hydrogenedentes bacterium]|nr:heparinase II/III family protein [Candidatus Hydrogenedentota bacterium]